ncbi:MAG: lysostaphin resistance A-like protein, partial [Bryobacteraceae bacterium]
EDRAAEYLCHAGRQIRAIPGHGAAITPMRGNQRLPAAAGVVIVFLWPFLFLGPNQRITNIHQDLTVMAGEWIATLVAAFIAFRLQKRGPSWLRIRMFGWSDLLAMVGAIVAAIALLNTAGRFVHSNAVSLEDLRQLPNVSLAFRLSLVLTAGICEEFLYRAFAIEELGVLIGNRWLAGLISLVFFTLAHIGRYGFTGALLIPGIIGAMLTLLYLWRSNLPLCMLMHAIVDGLALIVVPFLFASHLR